jgi:RsmE family RNA methyltransferase
VEIGKHGLVLDFPQELTPPLPRVPLRLIMGHVRPIVMQRLFKDMASLGIAELWIVNAGLTEASYFKSALWQEQSYIQYLLEGASQGADVLLPEVRRFYTLQACLDQLAASQSSVNSLGTRLYCHPGAFAPIVLPPLLDQQSWTIGIGPERGWTHTECQMFQNAGFEPRSMGSRILRTEIAASGIAVLAGMYS